MRKIYSSILAALFCIGAGAQAVNEQTAAELARKYLGTDAISSVPDVSGKKHDAGQAKSCYAFNSGNGGWVIIAGDERMTPVLGHCDNGSFQWEGMPDNIRAWFTMIDESYGKLQESNAVQSEKMRKAWTDGIRKGDSQTQKELKTALWNQGNPYNIACNKACGNKTVYTGCVATAMAIVMRYHNWPPQGKGTIPKYTTFSNRYNIAAVDIDGHSYNWNVMPLSDGGKTSWSSSAKTEVSDLIFHCGAAVQMDYTPNGSGAYSTDIPGALTKYFSYDKNCVLKLRDDFRTVGEWVKAIREEIDADRPVLYSAYGSEGGHQFVCDGYDTSTNELHFNWGWGGADNGFYAVSLSEIDLEYGQDAVFGLKPDKDGISSYADNIILDFYDTGYEVYGEGIRVSSGTVAKGSTFYVKGDYIFNYGVTDYNGAIKLALVDRYYNLKEFISSEINLSIPVAESGYLSFEEFGPVKCTIAQDTDLGDKIVLYYKNTQTGSFAPIDANPNGYFFAPYIPVYDVNYIEDSGSYLAGDFYYPTLSRGQRRISSVVWFIDGRTPSDIVSGIKLTSGTHTIKAEIIFSDGGKEAVIKNVTVK